MLDELGVVPSQILYVDDRPANLVPARQLGMDAVCFASSGVPGVQTMPELVATALS